MPDVAPVDLRLYQPQDHETLTIGAVSTPLTASKAGAAYLAEIVCETDEIRYWKDGGAPTSTQGVLVGAGEKFYLIGPELIGFRGIRVTADATLQIHYYVPRAGVRAWKP